MKINTVQFRTAQVDIFPDAVVARFKDGTENAFALGWSTDEYMIIAERMGYDDTERYALEHELAHHYIADILGWSHSWSVHTNKQHEAPWPDHIAWEEHLVNSFQKYVRTKEKDEFNVLHLVFRNELPKMRWEFSQLCKIALDKKLNVSYNCETGEIK